MFARKLKALGHHHPDTFSITDSQAVRNLVVWLEDQKIRHYKIEERGPIRDTESNYWRSALTKYLKDLGCPVQNFDNVKAVLNWLVSKAVHIEYAENGKQYNEKVEDKKKSIIQSDSWLHSINSDDPELKKGIESLKKILQIPSHPDHVTVLQAIGQLIEERLSDEVLHNATSEKQTEKKEYIKLDLTPLGFDTNDFVVNEAAKILRLLQIRNLRKLQTRINQSIVVMQNLSADPKTDQSLGKVGRK